MQTQHILLTYSICGYFLIWKLGQSFGVFLFNVQKANTFLLWLNVQSKILWGSIGGGGSKQHTQRTVAIAVGGVAALGFGIALLMCVKSLVKKRGGKQYE